MEVDSLRSRKIKWAIYHGQTVALSYRPARSALTSSRQSWLNPLLNFILSLELARFDCKELSKLK